MRDPSSDKPWPRAARIPRRWPCVGALLWGVVLGATVALGSGPSVEVPTPVPTPGAASGVWLGVWLADAVDGGVEVVALVPDGPVHQAGLRVGDVILEANDHQLTDQAELGRVLTDLRPGDRLRLRFLRAGEPVQARVQVSQRRPTYRVRAPRAVVDLPAAPSFHRLESMLPGQRLGLQVAQVTSDLRVHYGAPADLGVLVTRTEPGRPAERAGVQVGDILIKFGELEIGDPAQLERTLLRWNRERPLELTVVREGAPRVLSLNPSEAPTVVSAPTTERDRDVLLDVKRQEIERLQRRIEQLRDDIERLSKQP